jgi:hypothetical protein
MIPDEPSSTREKTKRKKKQKEKKRKRREEKILCGSIQLYGIISILASNIIEYRQNSIVLITKRIGNQKK